MQISGSHISENMSFLNISKKKKANNHDKEMFLPMFWGNYEITKATFAEPTKMSYWKMSMSKTNC